MNSFRRIALTSVLTLSVFSAIIYTSCQSDACATLVCKNQGTCAGGVCSCPTGYEGTDCSTLSRAKFLGTYTGTGGCGGTSPYPITVVADIDSLQFTLSNLDGKGLPVVCTITATNTFSFSAPGQTSTYSGTGTLTGTELSIDYTATSKSTGAVSPCSYVGYH